MPKNTLSYVVVDASTSLPVRLDTGLVVDRDDREGSTNPYVLDGQWAIGRFLYSANPAEGRHDRPDLLVNSCARKAAQATNAGETLTAATARHFRTHKLERVTGNPNLVVLAIGMYCVQLQRIFGAESETFASMCRLVGIDPQSPPQYE